jgi:hypothetical protein
MCLQSRPVLLCRHTCAPQGATHEAARALACTANAAAWSVGGFCTLRALEGRACRQAHAVSVPGVQQQSRSPRMYLASGSSFSGSCRSTLSPIVSVSSSCTCTCAHETYEVCICQMHRRMRKETFVLTGRLFLQEPRREAKATRQPRWAAVGACLERLPPPLCSVRALQGN